MTTPSISHEYASDQEVARQIQLWQRNSLVHLIADAMPTGVLILNEQRQAVFANQRFLQISATDSLEQILGKRPGEILFCVNADLEDTGCGSSLFCKHCGAMRAIVSSLFGDAAVEDCLLNRKPGYSPLELRVKTTPIEMGSEKFTIFAIEDISAERERDSLMEKLKTLSETDELTGLFNRRYLYQEAERELARAIRYQHPIACFMIDLDHFKEINDQYGHLIGDKLLVSFARVLRKSLRKADLIARWGGEEFVVLLPEADRAQASAAAVRLMEEVREIRVATDQGEIGITVSIGVTGLFERRQASFDELIKEADDALYQAKEQGRNRIVESQ